MPVLINVSEFSITYVNSHAKAKIETDLLKNGQTRPIVLDAAMCLGINWFDEIVVEAARDLEWKQILVTWPGDNDDKPSS